MAAPLPTVQALRAAIELEFADLLNPEFPRFSAAEMARRREAFAALCQRHDVDAVILAGALRAGTATFWLTGWPVTQEAITVLVPGRMQRMFVHHHNHLPLARRLVVETQVEWGREAGLS